MTGPSLGISELKTNDNISPSTRNVNLTSNDLEWSSVLEPADRPGKCRESDRRVSIRNYSFCRISFRDSQFANDKR